MRQPLPFGYGGPQSSVEWIQEAPEIGGSVTPLAHDGKTYFEAESLIGTRAALSKAPPASWPLQPTVTYLIDSHTPRVRTLQSQTMRLPERHNRPHRR